MRASRAYLLGCGLALPLLALVAGAQVVPVAASPDKSTTNVNRALKDDRLPLTAPAGEASPSLKTPGLPEGCEASVSAMTQSSLARTPARCLS